MGVTNVDSLVMSANSPALSACPPNPLFVPDHLQTQVLDWCHFMLVPYASAATLVVLTPASWCNKSFGGPIGKRMFRNLSLPVLSALSLKSSLTKTSGLLHPLPVPHCRWSHISLDFVTALPPSQDNTVNLTVVDRFSKMVHFVPLPKLPSAKETANLLLEHVFHLHGLPRDIVSDWGPQFWTEFLLGIAVSLFYNFLTQLRA